MKCHCGQIYEARQSDINRGWGLSCSKSCSAKRKTHKLNAATYADGGQVSNKLKSNKPKRKKVARSIDKTFDGMTNDEFYDATLHPFSSEALGQWQGYRVSELRNKLINSIDEINDSQDIAEAMEIAEDWINDVYHEISTIINKFSIDSIDDLDKISDAFGELETLKDKLY